MSDKNPNVNEILACTTGIIGEHFCKSYLNLAKMVFVRNNNRKPTIDDAQEIRDIYERQWVDYYIHQPIREKANKEKGKEIWEFGCSLKVDVYKTMCRFIEYKYGNSEPSCGQIMQEKKVEFLETFIIDEGLLDQWKQFTKDNQAKYPWHKRTYQDFSHLAYNNVTDDF